jgi:hypothetical protein
MLDKDEMCRIFGVNAELVIDGETTVSFAVEQVKAAIVRERLRSFFGSLKNAPQQAIAVMAQEALDG